MERQQLSLAACCAHEHLALITTSVHGVFHADLPLRSLDRHL